MRQAHTARRPSWTDRFLTETLSGKQILFTKALLDKQIIFFIGPFSHPVASYFFISHSFMMRRLEKASSTSGRGQERERERTWSTSGMRGPSWSWSQSCGSDEDPAASSESGPAVSWLGEVEVLSESSRAMGSTLDIRSLSL